MTDKFDMPEIFKAIISSVLFNTKKNQIPVNKIKKLFDFSYHTKRINIIFKRSLKK